MNITKLTQIVIAGAAAGALIVSIYTARQVNIVHLTVNSRMDELLALTKKDAKAEGVKEEQDKTK